MVNQVKIIKLLLSLVLVITLLSGGVYYLANRGLIPMDKIQAAQATLENPVLKNITGQLAMTFNRLKLDEKIPAMTTSVSEIPQLASIASESGAVLGTSAVESQAPPLPQRAFEYGRYLYCQEVIKDFEQRFPQP